MVGQKKILTRIRFEQNVRSSIYNLFEENMMQYMNLSGMKASSKLKEKKVVQ